MATLPFNNAKNQLSSKQSFKKTYFSKEASTLDVSGFLLIDTIHGVWSYLPPRRVSTGLSMCLTKAEQLKQNIFFNFCCFWILLHIISKMQCLLVLSATPRSLHRAVDVSQVVEVVVQAGNGNNFFGFVL